MAQRLERHPEVMARVLRLLDVMENTAGDVRPADEAERRAIDELRAMGQEVPCSPADLSHDWRKVGS